MLGQDIAAALPRLRAEAESLMTDVAVIERLYDADLDPVTLQESSRWVLVQTTPCRVAPSSGSASPQETSPGDHEWSVPVVEIHVPHDTEGIERGDRVTVANRDLVATVMRVPRTTQSVRLRLTCEEVV